VLTSGRDYAPSWAPGGKRLVFTRVAGDAQRVWVVRRDGSGLRPLRGAECGGDPAWSPDGKRVAFICNYRSLYTVKVTGGGLKRVTTTDKEMSIDSIAWQPRPR
jgi:Tol biopolymer transport system component